MSENETVKKEINLRELDDVACSNVVVTRQIKHLIRKNSALSDITIDCWVHNGHYTKFTCKNERLSWHSEDHEPHDNDLKKIDHNTDCLYNDEWNKLLVETYRSMCDSLNGVDLEDTPEDILAFAETKLREMLSDEQDSTAVNFNMQAPLNVSSNDGYVGENYNNNLFYKLTCKL